MCTPENVVVVNIDESQYDLDSFWGRAQHFLHLHNPLNLLVPHSTLEDARCLYLKFRCSEPLPDGISQEDIWAAKALYNSAYNPRTGEEIPILARPGALAPVNMVLAGGMMAYYKSTPGVIFWQWLNQTYNAFVAYANRGGDVVVTDKQIMTSYAVATGTAIGTALGLNHLFRCSPSLIGRFVPLAAVAAAHCVSVPFMKAQVLRNGAPIYDECNVRLGYSRKAAEAGIGGSTFNKIMMAVPPMVLTPLSMHYLEGRGTLCRYPWMNFPAHVAIAGLCLAFISPLACAILAPKAHIPFTHLEPEMQEYLCKKFYARPPKYVYYDRS